MKGDTENIMDAYYFRFHTDVECIPHLHVNNEFIYVKSGRLRVTVNGRSAKASYDVKVGDVIEIAFGQRSLKAGRKVPRPRGRRI